MRGQGIRFSIAEAKKLGVPDSTLAPIIKEQKRQAKKKRESKPQRMLFDALQAIYGDRVVWEQKELIPGRKFSVDIYFPEVSLGVECDGWEHHGKHLDDFLRCRNRHNEFTKRGVALLRIPAGDINRDMTSVITLVGETLNFLSHKSTTIVGKPGAPCA